MDVRTLGAQLEGLRDATSPGIFMAQLLLAEPSFQLGQDSFTVKFQIRDDVRKQQEDYITVLHGSDIS